MCASRFRRVCATVAMGWAIALLAGGAEGAPANGPTSAPLRVSAATDNFPYSYLDSKGELRGFAVDLLDAVAARMHLGIVREPMASMDEMARFAARDIDLVQHRARIPGREGDAVYSMPYLVAHGAVFVRKGDRRFASLADLKAARAHLAAPPQGCVFALASGLESGLVREASSVDCLQLLASGQVDAALLTRLTGLSQARHLGIKNVETVGPTLEGFTVRFCYVAHSDRADLIERLNEGLSLVHGGDQFGRIYRKWFAHYEPNVLTPLEVAGAVAIGLAMALVVALWALIRQRELRRRIARQAEELAESRSMLAEAQTFARLGHWHLHQDGTSILRWSEEIFRILELNPAHGTPKLGELAAFMGEEERDRWQRAIQALVGRNESPDLEVAISTPSGTRKIVHVRGRPWIDGSGRKTGFFGTVQDVTALRASEAALRGSEELLRALYENLPLALGVFERGSDGWLVMSLNPEGVRQLGLPDAPCAGTKLAQLGLPKDSLRYWEDLLNRCMEGRLPLRTELLKTERQRAYSVILVPLHGSGPHPRCCFLAEDVTERVQKDAEIARGRRLRAIGELVGGIAHEFNNLLTPIVLNSDLLQNQWAHLPGLREELRMIGEAARRSADLTRRLLAFGRKTDRRPEVIDLRSVVEANIDLVRHASDRRVCFESTVAAELPALFLNSGDLHQVLLNLLLNARDTLADKMTAPPEGGWSPCVRVEACQHPPDAASPQLAGKGVPELGWIRLTIRDNGKGMPAEVQERIFEPFYTTKDVGRGTGLGLATVWHVVTEIGGRIDVESTPDAGSAFHIFLPVRPPPAAVEAPAARPSTGAPTPPRHILLLEDEESVARVVMTLLKRKGHDVRHSANGEEGWQRFSAAPQQFDAVIMDLNLPGLNGREFARRARALPYNRPLIVMSGRVTEEERAELTRLRIDAVVNKPFTLEVFYSALDSVLK